MLWGGLTKWIVALGLLGRWHWLLKGGRLLLLLWVPKRLLLLLRSRLGCERVGLCLRSISVWLLLALKWVRRYWRRKGVGHGALQ